MDVKSYPNAGSSFFLKTEINHQKFQLFKRWEGVGRGGKGWEGSLKGVRKVRLVMLPSP